MVTFSGTIRSLASVELDPEGVGPDLPDINEGEETTTFTVVLGSQPTDDVVFDVNTSSSDVSLPLDSRLTFTPGDWSREQTVTVTSRVDNDFIGGNAAYTVTVAVDEAVSAEAFASLPAKNAQRYGYR